MNIKPIAIFITFAAASSFADAATRTTEVHTIHERYTTALEPKANLDSVAMSPAAADHGAMLFATAKSTNVVKVYDASTGEERFEIGETGDSSEGFLRPNGVSVADDLLLVVERDNRRVSVRAIPGFMSLATFGDDVLKKPYGLWVQDLGNDQYRLFVTDNYEGSNDTVPPNDELGERVKQWLLTVNRDANGNPTAVDSLFEKSFGDTAGPGVLRVVESLFGDPLYNRLLIAEEDSSPATGLVIKEYDLAGRFVGSQMGAGIFSSQAEGIALRACEDGSGYWLTTDQAKDRSVFHVFDRETLKHAGAFRGNVTANTDGIWLSEGGIPGFDDGIFFAVHDDQAVSAFAWSEIANALDLQACN
jgi:3-phytase